jgi:hypothetical protein
MTPTMTSNPMQESQRCPQWTPKSDPRRDGKVAPVSSSGSVAGEVGLQDGVARIREYVDSEGSALRIDRQGGVIRGVKILGFTSKNGRRYLPEAVRDALPLYDGAKVNVNHPRGSAGPARNYEDRLGVMRNVRFVEREGVFGDLHFNPAHALAEQLSWDARHAPGNVGLSHHVEGRVVRRDGQWVVEEILRVEGVDLVADPATTEGLFESFPQVEISAAASDASDRNESPNVAVHVIAPPSNTQLECRSASVSTFEPDEQSEIDRHLEQQTGPGDSNVASPAAPHSELQRLREECARLREQQNAQHRREQVDGLLQRSQLVPEGASRTLREAILSDTFRQALLAAESDLRRKAMIHDRERLVEAMLPQDQAPVSREPTEYRFESAVQDARQFAAAIRNG